MINPESLKNLKPFAKGNDWGGRTTGARDKITQHFLRSLCKDFEANGERSIADMREKDVVRYVLCVASLLPKEVTVTRPLEGFADDELAAIAEHLRSFLSPQGDRPRNLNA